MTNDELDQFEPGDVVVLADGMHGERVRMTVQQVVTVQASSDTGLTPGVHVFWLDHQGRPHGAALHPRSLLHEEKYSERRN